MTGDRFLVRFMRRQSTKARGISEICTHVKFSNYTDLKSLVCGPQGFPARKNKHGHGFRLREMLHRDVTVVRGHQPRSQKITFSFLSTQSIHTETRAGTKSQIYLRVLEGIVKSLLST